MASMNLGRLQDEAGSRLRNRGIEDAQLTIWANNAVDEIASKIDFPHLWSREVITTVSGTRTYYLRKLLPGQISMVVDETNEQEFYPRSEEDLIRLDLSRSDTGQPSYYSLTGTKQYEGQPATASTITIVSSSGSDTTQKVRIRGLVSSSENYELLTLNGLSTVAGSLSFSEIRGVSKDGVTAGKITVTSTTGSVTLADLPRARFSVDYQEMNLTPVPSAALTLGVFGYRRPMDLGNTEDIPELPEQFHELIVMGMQRRGHEFLFDFNRANELMALSESRLKDVVSRMSSDAGITKYLIGRRTRRYGLPGRLPPEFGYG